MFSLLCLLIAGAAMTEEDAEITLTIQKVEKLVADNDAKGALELLEKSEKRHPKEVRFPLLRASIHEARAEHRQTVAALTNAVKLKPNNHELLSRRGDAHFKAGMFKESVADFNAEIEVQPRFADGHWKRGISMWYAGQYDAGRKQFEGYEKVDTNDVENAVWHFLCVARKDGVDKARKSILKIGKDRRIPMMNVYEMFKGNAKPEDIIKAMDEGNPDKVEKSKRLFYGHLYLGIWFDITGEPKKALDHMQKSVDQGNGHHPYMWEVARVHRDLLKAKK